MTLDEVKAKLLRGNVALRIAADGEYGSFSITLDDLPELLGDPEGFQLRRLNVTRETARIWRQWMEEYSPCRALTREGKACQAQCLDQGCFVTEFQPGFTDRCPIHGGPTRSESRS